VKVGEIELVEIDDCRATSIVLSCWRETGRLQRMLRVYLRALDRADRGGRAFDFANALVGLHDHKGVLTVTWCCFAHAFDHMECVEDAWEDENECEVEHKDVLDTELSDIGDTPFGGVVPCKGGARILNFSRPDGDKSD
jgi:hypothetical protein